MANANDDKMREYDVASEEIENFIDETIVNKIIEKMEEQSKTTKEANGKLVSIDESIAKTNDNSKIAKDKAQFILKLLMRNPEDKDIFDYEKEYEEFDLVKHSTWEREQIECLIKRPEFNADPIFERITKENNRVKREIVKEVVDRLIAENLSQKEKTQEIIKILIDQDKEEDEIQSEEYYHFDVVDKINFNEKKVEEISKKVLTVGDTVNSIKQEQIAAKDQILGVLINETGDTIPNYFDRIKEKVETDLEKINGSNKELLNSIEKDIKECQDSIVSFTNRYDIEYSNMQVQINNILLGFETIEENRNKSIKGLLKKIYICGGIIIFIQFVSIIISLIRF